MNKKGIIGIVIAIAIIIIAVIGFVVYNSNNEQEENNLNNLGNTENENAELETNKNNNNVANTNSAEPEDKKEESSSNGNKTIVVYYSAQSHTKAVAEKIANNLNADIFEIVPEEIYTSEDLNWTNNNSRVVMEHDNESLRNIKLTTTDVENWENYDTVLIGYPIWWGIAAWPVDTFVKANDFNGKTVIPFCTSTSSGLGESGKLLEEEANGGIWKEGHRFNERPSDSDIKTWTDSLKQ